MHRPVSPLLESAPFAFGKETAAKFFEILFEILEAVRQTPLAEDADPGFHVAPALCAETGGPVKALRF